jgi:hypothetical protein
VRWNPELHIKAVPRDLNLHRHHQHRPPTVEENPVEQKSNCSSRFLARWNIIPRKTASAIRRPLYKDIGELEKQPFDLALKDLKPNLSSHRFSGVNLENDFFRDVESLFLCLLE